MNNDQEKESHLSGNLEIIKSDKSDDKFPSSKSVPAGSNNTEIKEEDNDAKFDPRIYQLKSDRLEKTLTECEKEIMFLVDLLKNKIPKKDKKEKNGPENPK